MRRAHTAGRTSWQPALNGGLLAAVLVAVLARPADRPTAAPPQAAPPAPATVCTISDPRAVGLSGLLATPTGYLVQNGRTPAAPEPVGVFVLDHSCAVTDTIAYPHGAIDPEDLATGPDGTVWVADTGDTDVIHPHLRRDTVTLWRLSHHGAPPTPFPLRYPDGPHDAEALLFDAGNRPILVTKDATGRAGLYTTGAPLRRGPQPALLHRAGTFIPARTGTRNPFGSLGAELVTGAAVAPDRSWVTLRTYADAYTWHTSAGDLISAITTATPAITPLPDEPQGEAIAATTDSRALLTVSDQAGPTRLLRYTPAAPPTGAGEAGHGLAAAAAAGLFLIAIGLFGARLTRRRAPAPDPGPTGRHSQAVVDLATVKPPPTRSPGAGT
ncbi:hypothetical protein [Dactylosporangium salmoneum]|uniref:hypothetical protein n=1 Tax=Dactylosporangium salmoneum TaxID=53361 RepID=UPI0031D1C969